MKKIGILTFSRVRNYGAVLQSWALKNIILKLGHSCEIINYSNNFLSVKYKLMPNHKIFNFKELILDILRLPLKLLETYNFCKFNSFLYSNKKIFFKRDLYSLNDKYDLFIVGSDQVWNLDLTGNDTSYFLDFVTDNYKKNAYAASFGKDRLTEEQKKIFRYFLEKFNKLSVREIQGQNIIKELIDKEIPVLLDPTMLLDKNDWENIAIFPKKNNFILLYLMDFDRDIINFAEKFAKHKKIEIIYLSSAFRKKINAKYVNPIPQEWVGYFMNAEYIVTNSFHGLCFAINFNKHFFVDLLPLPANVNSRLENILDLFNLRDRLIDNIGNDYDRLIDYEFVNKILEIEREKSINYLKEIIK